MIVVGRSPHDRTQEDGLLPHNLSLLVVNVKVRIHREDVHGCDVAAGSRWPVGLL